MAFFFTDADLSGAGETAEAEVWLSTEFTVPDGSAPRFRWRFPAVASGVTPLIRLFDAGGTALPIGAGGATTLAFDSSTNDAWNIATPPSPVALSAGTYRLTVNTTRYVFVGGFFSGGPITRSGVTAVRGRFGSPGSAPASTAATLYTPDMDFTASGGGGGATPTGVAVPVGLGQPATAIPAAAPAGLAISAALGQPTAALNRSAGPTGLAVAVALGTPTVGRNGSSPNGLAVATALGTPTVALNRAASPAGLAVPVALGAPSTSAPGRAITTRPFTGITARPTSGTTPRP